MAKIPDPQNYKLKTQWPPRRDVGLSGFEKSRTNQESAHSLSMESIKLKMDRGIPFPQTQDIFYSTEIPQFQNLQDVKQFGLEMTDKFERLPLELRKLMNHDIKNLHDFFINPENQEILNKHGFIAQNRDGITEIVSAITQLSKNLSKNDLNEPKNKSPDDQNQA